MEWYDQMLAEYPRLKGVAKNFAYKASPQDNSGRLLEFYPQGETDSFDPSKPAIETFGDNPNPHDLAGDITSHYLASGVDPIISGYYKDFESSLTPDQKSRLQEQYQWAQKNEGEKRPYKDWYSASGLPAYFRGYAFRQWPQPNRMYSAPQINMFDRMLNYLKTENQ